MTSVPQTLREILADTVGARGDADAIVTEGTRLSYRQLADEAWQVAKAMHALGLRRGDLAGVLRSLVS